MISKAKEIGGYLQFEEYYGDEYHSGATALNSARSALLYILKSKNAKKLYLPYYLCSSVSEMCEKYGYKTEYYNVGGSFEPDFEKTPLENEYVYIVNYFGQLDNARLKRIKEKYKNIIVDNVQAFYQMPLENTDTVYSCRKFFGVPDGGYAYTTSDTQLNWRKGLSGFRTDHLIGRYEKGANEYYGVFQKNELSFSDETPAFMSDLTKNLMRSFDYQKKMKKREENFGILEEHYRAQNALGVKVPTGPYCYPLYVRNGAEARKALAEKKIYIPVLWPLPDSLKETAEYDYSINILPLPCDQRYGPDDMKYLCGVAEEIIKPKND